MSELSDITPIKRGAGRLIPSKPITRRGAMAAATTTAAADNNATVKSLATRTLLGGGKTENTDKFLRLAGSHQYKSTYLLALWGGGGGGVPPFWGIGFC